MVWLGVQNGHVLDWVSQRWVRATGLRLRSTDAPWLDGPAGSPRGIGADFFERWGERRGLKVMPSQVGDGLLAGLETLSARDFDPEAVHPRLHELYTHTTAFDLHVRCRWSPAFSPAAWFIARVFARRLRQLNLPTTDQHLRGGLESRVVKLVNDAGEVCATGWVRSSPKTGLPVFVGQYGTATIPGSEGQCVKVVFPLPNGNAIVFLRPRVEPNGGLSLLSDGSRFGEAGFYFTVRAAAGEVYARYVETMKEELVMQVQGDAIVGRHRFWVFGLCFLELHYRLTTSPSLAQAIKISRS